MEYSIELLCIERDKLREEFDRELNQNPPNWDVVVRNERLLEDLNNAIDLLWESKR